MSFKPVLHIPRFKLPFFCSLLGQRLPQWPPSLGLCAALNLAVKMQLIPVDRLDLLHERKLRIDVEDTGCKLCFTVRNGLFCPLFSVPETPDLLFRANLSAFMQLMTRQEDPDTLFFNRDLVIEGDTELGLVLKNMFDAIEWPRFQDLLRPQYKAS